MCRILNITLCSWKESSEYRSKPALASIPRMHRKKKSFPLNRCRYHAFGYPIIESSVLTPLSTKFPIVSHGYTWDRCRVMLASRARMQAVRKVACFILDDQHTGHGSSKPTHGNGELVGASSVVSLLSRRGLGSGGGSGRSRVGLAAGRARLATG